MAVMLRRRLLPLLLLLCILPNIDAFGCDLSTLDAGSLLHSSSTKIDSGRSAILRFDPASLM
jgi:hypothetical protein